MEKFKGVLKKRLVIMIALNGIAITLIALMALYSLKTSIPNDDILDAIHGVQVGIFLGLQLVMGIFIAKYSKALKDDNELKKAYIEENDERTKLINDRIGGIGFAVVLGGVGTATVISGFFNQLVFMTLVAVLVFIVIVKATLKVYYHKKI